GDVTERLLLAWQRGGECAMGLYLVDIGRDELHAHFAPPADAHEVHHADRAGARLRFHDGNAVDDGVDALMGVPGDDEVHRSRVELSRDVEDLTMTGRCHRRIAH